MKIKWRHRQHCEWSRQQHVLLYVIKWQMIRFPALWKTKSFVKVCLKFKLPLWTKGLLIHLSPLWQLPLWHFPRWHNFPVTTRPVAVCQHDLYSNDLADSDPLALHMTSLIAEQSTSTSVVIPREQKPSEKEEKITSFTLKKCGSLPPPHDFFFFFFFFDYGCPILPLCNSTGYAAAA